MYLCQNYHVCFLIYITLFINHTSVKLGKRLIYRCHGILYVIAKTTPLNVDKQKMVCVMDYHLAVENNTLLIIWNNMVGLQNNCQVKEATLNYINYKYILQQTFVQNFGKWKLIYKDRG